MRFGIHSFLMLIALSLIFSACGPSSAPTIVSSSNTPSPQNTGKTVSASGTPSDKTRLPDMPKKAQPSQAPADLRTLGWKLQKGEKQTLADYKGKVVVLDFWATYCPPCLAEIPHLVNLQTKHKDEGLRVIGLHVGGDDDKPFVPSFVQRLNIQYDLGEPQPELIDTLFGGSDVIPQTFVFDRNGQLIKGFSGYSLDVREGLDKAVEEALANQN
jgi:thiol-disulfide isomerase/thioredoxin